MTPRPLATNSSCVATSRTWLMLPGADGKRDEKTVCTESTTSAAGLSALDLLEDPLERGLGHQVEPAALDAEPLAAQLDLALRLLARDVEHGAVGAARAGARPAAAACSCRCRARRRSAPASPARCRRRARGRTRRCRRRTRGSSRAVDRVAGLRARGAPAASAARRAGPCPAAARPPGAPRRSCSTRRSRGSGPSHFELSKPQAWQAKTTAAPSLMATRPAAPLEVLEARELLDEGELARAGRAVALLADDDLRDAAVLVASACTPPRGR